jgi:acyl carrier protein
MTKEKIFSIVKSNLLDILEDADEAAITPDKSMKELGANSLDIVEVVSTSMREVKVKIPRSELNTLTNIGQLVDALYAAANNKVDA